VVHKLRDIVITVSEKKLKHYFLAAPRLFFLPQTFIAIPYSILFPSFCIIPNLYLPLFYLYFQLSSSFINLSLCIHPLSCSFLLSHIIPTNISAAQYCLATHFKSLLQEGETLRIDISSGLITFCKSLYPRV
jgi:hypothetical protein